MLGYGCSRARNQVDIVNLLVGVDVESAERGVTDQAGEVERSPVEDQFNTIETPPDQGVLEVANQPLRDAPPLKPRQRGVLRHTFQPMIIPQPANRDGCAGKTEVADNGVATVKEDLALITTARVGEVQGTRS